MGEKSVGEKSLGENRGRWDAGFRSPLLRFNVFEPGSVDCGPFTPMQALIMSKHCRPLPFGLTRQWSRHVLWTPFI